MALRAAAKPSLGLQDLGGPFRASAPRVALKSVPNAVRELLPQGIEGFALYPADAKVNSKIYLTQGDITRLRIDAVQNAANEGLQGGGGIDGAIHRAAGPELRRFNARKLLRCPTGEAKVSPGFNLPAKFIVNTVGPVGEKPELLRKAYLNTLEAAFNLPLPSLDKASGGQLFFKPQEPQGVPAKRKSPEEPGAEPDRVLAKRPAPRVRSIALCGVSTGVYGYPPIKAAHMALSTVRRWLDVPANLEKVEAIVFCTFLEQDLSIYKELIPYYFPPPPKEEEPQAPAGSEKEE